MRKLIKLFFSLTFLLGSSFWFFPVWAGEKICQECHAQRFMRQNFTGSIESLVADLSVYQAKLDPCPGRRTVAEELFLTESRLQKYASLLYAEEKDRAAVQGLKKKINQSGREFEILKQQRIDSLRELAKATSTLRLSLQKIYEQIGQMREEREKRWLIGLGSLIFLFFFFIFLIALRKVSRWEKILALTIFLIINWGLISCSTKLGEAPQKKVQEQLNQALALAQKKGKELEDTYQRILLLIALAKEYAPIDPAAAKQTWKLAQEIATRTKEGNKEITSFLEGYSSSLPLEKINTASLSELRGELTRLQGSIFLSRLVAEEWLAVDPKEGSQFLKDVTEEVFHWPEGDLRDRELKALAEIWSAIEKEEALKLISRIKDPFGRALSLGRLARTYSDKDATLLLWPKAEQEIFFIKDSWRRVQALMRLAGWAGSTSPQEGERLAEITWKKIKELPDPQLQSWAAQEMIKNWAKVNRVKAEEWLKRIPPELAESRVYALLYLARHSSGTVKVKYLLQAIEEAQAITDELGRRKLYAWVWEDLFLTEEKEAFKYLQELKDPYILEQIKPKIWRTAAKDGRRQGWQLVQDIGAEELRYPLILELLKDLVPEQRELLRDLYREVRRLAQELSSPYQRWLILRELSERWGRLEIKGKVACLEEAEKILSEISNPPQRAEILASLAASWKDIDEQRSKRLLARLDEEKYSAQKILEEMRLWGKLDIKKVQELLKDWPAEFPAEKIQAHMEIIRLLKKGKPEEAWPYFEHTWEEARKVSASSKVMAELVREGATLDKKGLRKLIGQVPSRGEQDFLLLELAKALIKGGQIADVEVAWQMIEEINDISSALDLYDKIGALLRMKKMEQASTESLRLELAALQDWPANQEKAVAKALPIKKAKLKARLLAFFAISLSQIDEEKALAIAEKISALDQEAYSFALYKIGSQLRRWNRTKAGSVLDQAWRVAEKIKEEDERFRRSHQVAKEIYNLNQDLAQRVLQKLLSEFPARRREILLTLVEWQPHRARQIAQETENLHERAQIILRGAEILMAKEWAENIRLLEKATQWAKGIDNSRWPGEVAEIWILSQGQKGWEIWRQIGSLEERVKILLRILRDKNYLPREEMESISEKAISEALKIEEKNLRIKFLIEIGSYWNHQDKQKAKAIFSQAYHIAHQIADFRS